MKMQPILFAIAVGVAVTTALGFSFFRSSNSASGATPVVGGESDPAAVEIGAPAPAFTLPSSGGKTISLKDFKGKYVVLEWWNRGCPYVRAHYDGGSMQDTQKWATDQKVVWLTITSSAEGKEGYVTASEAEQQSKDWKMHSSHILLDPNGDVGHLYKATNTPHMYVINPDGVLIYRGAIDDGPSDEPKKAKNYVRTALTEALAGKPVSQPSVKPYGCSVKYKN